MIKLRTRRGRAWSVALAIAAIPLALSACASSDQVTVSDFRASAAVVCESEGAAWAEAFNRWASLGEVELGGEFWREAESRLEQVVESGKAFSASLSSLERPTLKSASWSAQDFNKVLASVGEITDVLGKGKPILRSAARQANTDGTVTSRSLFADYVAWGEAVQGTTVPSARVERRALGPKCFRVLSNASN